MDIDPQANWAFFPLYVIVCAALKAVTGGLINTYVIGMIVSNICIIIAAFFAVKGLKKQTSIKEEYTMIMPVLFIYGTLHLLLQFCIYGRRCL